MNSIEAKNVSKSYGEKVAINQISLQIPKGSIYGLLGPNGAGKTTFLRIINQIINKDSGELLFDNRPLQLDDIQKIGYLPEERGLYPDMKVGDQVIYFGKLKGLTDKEAKKNIKFWFERLSMNSFWDKKVSELSKGMAQKVQFVISVLHQPKLLIFDEVFSGFDPVNAALIKDQIKYLNQQGATILFSSHRMENVEEICTHIALIHQSEVQLEGEITEVKDTYKKNEFIIKTGLEIDLNDVKAEGIEIQNSSSNELQVKVNDETLFQNWLKEKILPYRLIHLSEIIPSLNEIFIQIAQQ